MLMRPLVRLSNRLTIRTVLSLATSRHWSVHQLDIKNAFLHGGLSETVYMHQPPRFHDSAHPNYGADTTHLPLYVDDIVLTYSFEVLLQRIIASLHQEFSMTDLGSLNYFLAISIMRDSSGMFLSQRKCDAKIIERAHMINYNPNRTPVDTESKVGDDGDPVSDMTLYRSLAVADSDADWTLSRSSVEAECRGVVNAVVETCWLRKLLRELHTSLPFATLVYCDQCCKKSAVYLSSNPVQHQRTKHIEIDIHFVRDFVAAGRVRVLHVPSRYQYAGIFTKGLHSALFEEFRTSLIIRCPPA
ncbi:ribonuclease H-like domain-containing protein [Tanacetum coccineum]